MGIYSLVATVLVTIGIVVAILLFERRRAEQIERDLHDQRGRDDRG